MKRGDRDAQDGVARESLVHTVGRVQEHERRERGKLVRALEERARDFRRVFYGVRGKRRRRRVDARRKRFAEHGVQTLERVTSQRDGVEPFARRFVITQRRKAGFRGCSERVQAARVAVRGERRGERLEHVRRKREALVFGAEKRLLIHRARRVGDRGNGTPGLAVEHGKRRPSLLQRRQRGVLDRARSGRGSVLGQTPRRRVETRKLEETHRARQELELGGERVRELARGLGALGVARRARHDGCGEPLRARGSLARVRDRGDHARQALNDPGAVVVAVDAAAAERAAAGGVAFARLAGGRRLGQGAFRGVQERCHGIASRERVRALRAERVERAGGVPERLGRLERREEVRRAFNGDPAFVAASGDVAEPGRVRAYDARGGGHHQRVRREHRAVRCRVRTRRRVPDARQRLPQERVRTLALARLGFRLALALRGARAHHQPLRRAGRGARQKQRALGLLPARDGVQLARHEPQVPAAVFRDPAHPEAVIEHVHQNLFAETVKRVAVLARVAPGGEPSRERGVPSARRQHALEQRRAQTGVALHDGDGVKHQEVVRARLHDAALVRLRQRQNQGRQREARFRRRRRRRERRVALHHRHGDFAYVPREIFLVGVTHRGLSAGDERLDHPQNRALVLPGDGAGRSAVRQSRDAKLRRLVSGGGVVRAEARQRAAQQTPARARELPRGKHDTPSSPFVQLEPRQSGVQSRRAERLEARLANVAAVFAGRRTFCSARLEDSLGGSEDVRQAGHERVHERLPLRGARGVVGLLRDRRLHLQRERHASRSRRRAVGGGERERAVDERKRVRRARARGRGGHHQAQPARGEVRARGVRETRQVRTHRLGELLAVRLGKRRPVALAFAVQHVRAEVLHSGIGHAEQRQRRLPRRGRGRELHEERVRSLLLLGVLTVQGLDRGVHLGGGHTGAPASRPRSNLADAPPRVRHRVEQQMDPPATHRADPPRLSPRPTDGLARPSASRARAGPGPVTRTRRSGAPARRGMTGRSVSLSNASADKMRPPKVVVWRFRASAVSVWPSWRVARCSQNSCDDELGAENVFFAVQ